MTIPSLAPALLLAAAGLVPAATAQLRGNALPVATYVVDDDGGEGAHFTSIAAAIAMVPSGAVLRIRPGTYSGFRIANRTLTILGDDSTTVIVSPQPGDPGSGDVVIGPTDAGDDVFVGGIGFPALWSGPPPLVKVDGARGAVVCDDLSLSMAALSIADSPNVHLHGVRAPQANWPNVFSSTIGTRLSISRSRVELAHSLIEGWTMESFPTRTGGIAITADASNLLCAESTVRGGAGAACPVTLVFCQGANGGTGMVLDASTLLALGAAIEGGNGSWSCCPPFSSLPNGRGGIGLQARNGSLAQCEGVTPLGGLPGGQPFVRAPGWAIGFASSVVVNPSALPARASLVGTPAAGAAVTFHLRAQPASLAWVLIGSAPVHGALEPLVTGALLASPKIWIGPVAVPLSGDLGIPVVIPATWPQNAAMYAQFLTRETTGMAWASNSFPWLVKSP